jgi:hypothetical protein
MPSILRDLPAVSWVAGKNFNFKGTNYKVGEEIADINEFPRVEVYVRTRHVIPVVERAEDIPFQFRHVVMTRERANRKLASGHPGGGPADVPVSTPVRQLETDEKSERTDQGYDPSDHTIDDVLAHVGEDSQKATEIYVAEEQGKNRSTLLTKLEDIINKEDADV